jgi:tetratricopeptide (TPR) repeat protein
MVHVENAIREARRAIAEGRLEDAERDLLQVLELDDSEPRALALLGRVARSLGQGERALDLYEQALESQDLMAAAAEPAPLATPTLAELYAEQGHAGAAAQVYRDLLAARPEDERAPEWRERLAALTAEAPPAPDGGEAEGRLRSFLGSLERFREIRRLQRFLERLGG